MEQAEESSAAVTDVAAQKRERTMRLWRYSAQGMARLVGRGVRELNRTLQLEKEEDRRIRQMTALVLSAQRAMEMENQYEQKVQRHAGRASESESGREQREEAAYQRAREQARRVVLELRDEDRGADRVSGACAQ